MRLFDIYVLVLRLAGLILGYYWLSAIVWAFYYFISPDDGGTGYLIAQYMFQGVLLYLLIFESPRLVRWLFGSETHLISSSRMDLTTIVRAGIALIGLLLVLIGLPSLILKLFSGHSIFREYDAGFTLISIKELMLSVVHIILGILVILSQRKLTAWITIPRDHVKP